MDRINTCQLISEVNDTIVNIGGENGIFDGLGPLDSTNTLLRNIEFPSGSTTNRLIVKFSAAIDDSGII